MKKKLYNVSLLIGIIFLSGSCMERDIDFTQYDEYASVLSFSYSGLLTVDYNNIGRDVEVKIQGEEQEELIRIHKGGTDPLQSATAQLVLMTQEELDAYNEENGSTYQFLPEEFYTMPKEVVIGSDIDGCPISIVLKTNLGEDEDAHYNQVIPIKLMTETSKVNSYNNTLIIAPKIITPTVSLDAIGLQTVTMYDFTTAAEKIVYETGLSLDFFNEWEFSVKLVNDQEKLKELVSTYNTNNGTEYIPLSPTNYELPSTVEFSSNESSKGFSITLNKTGLDAGEYLLPVLLDEVEEMPFKVSEHILYIRLILTKELPRLVFAKELTSTNSAAFWKGGSARPAFDNDVSTYWRSQYESYEGYTEPVNDPIYGVYLDVDLSTTNIRLKTMLNFIVKVRGYTRDSLPYKVRLYGGTGEDDLQPISDELLIELSETPQKQTVFENPIAVSLPESGITYLRFAVLEKINKNNNKIYKLTEKKNPDGTWNWNDVTITELEYYGL